MYRFQSNCLGTLQSLSLTFLPLTANTTSTVSPSSPTLLVNSSQSIEVWNIYLYSDHNPNPSTNPNNNNSNTFHTDSSLMILSPPASQVMNYFQYRCEVYQNDARVKKKLYETKDWATIHHLSDIFGKAFWLENSNLFLEAFESIDSIRNSFFGDFWMYLKYVVHR